MGLLQIKNNNIQSSIIKNCTGAVIFFARDCPHLTNRYSSAGAPYFRAYLPVDFLCYEQNGDRLTGPRFVTV